MREKMKGMKKAMSGKNARAKEGEVKNEIK